MILNPIVIRNHNRYNKTPHSIFGEFYLIELILNILDEVFPKVELVVSRAAEALGIDKSGPSKL